MMTISPHPESAYVLGCLQQLASQTAPTQWRGLLVIKADSEVSFTWPAVALVLAESLGDYREYLGTTRPLLVLDMRNTLHGDALAALLPTVSAKGLAILVLPRDDSPFSNRLLRFLPTNLCQSLTLKPLADTTTWEMNLRSFHLASQVAEVLPDTSRPCSVRSLKQEQTEVFHQLIQHIKNDVPAPVLINAPRGRGKSTLLGVLAKKLSEQSDPVWLCAPSRRQAATLLSAAGIDLHGLPGTEKIHFIAPDALLTDQQELIQGHLIVDEAASLPRHMLDRLIERYPKAIMATTSEGYETCGRGFLLQFQTQLHSEFRHFLSLRLEQPIRFAARCPLEEWLNRALLLTPSGLSGHHHLQSEPVDSASDKKSSQDLSASQISYSAHHASTLDEDTLAACFYLLMDAHYQTSPNDLKLLLNDPSQNLHLQWTVSTSGRALLGVVWLSTEGGLNEALATAVMRGNRRPPGNLLPQNLARHLQDPAPAMARWLRIVRIAVRSDCQQQGLGSVFIRHLIAEYSGNEEEPDIAGFGTSFASAPQINRFWQGLGFRPVRIGSRRDSATARHSLLMVYPLQTAWEHAAMRWTGYFTQELPAYQRLYQLNADYLASVQLARNHSSSDAYGEAQAGSDQPAYAAWADHRTFAFACGYLDLDSMRPTLLTRFPVEVENDTLLKIAVLTSVISSDDKRRLKLSGRKALIKQVRQICLRLIARI